MPVCPLQRTDQSPWNKSLRGVSWGGSLAGPGSGLLEPCGGSCGWWGLIGQQFDRGFFKVCFVFAPIDPHIPLCTRRHTHTVLASISHFPAAPKGGETDYFRPGASYPLLAQQFPSELASMVTQAPWMTPQTCVYSPSPAHTSRAPAHRHTGLPPSTPCPIPSISP